MNHSACKRAPRSHQRGVTLIELMVGFTIAILLTLAAVSFAAHETRLMGISRERLDLAQATRAAIDLLAEDLKQAGTGIGYQANGTFAGLMLDRFTINGLSFNENGPGVTPFNPPIGAQGPGVRTDLTLEFAGRNGSTFGSFDSIATDIGIITANGSYATIVEYDAPAGGGVARGSFCENAETNFRNGEVVVLRSQSSLDGFSGVMTPGVSGPCNAGNGHGCLGGVCTPFDLAPDAFFQTDPNVQNRSFLGGEISGGLKTIVWFSLDNGPTASLRRAVFDDRTGCAIKDGTCGGLVVDNVEAFVAQAWTFSEAVGQWTNAGQEDIANNDRIRVDVELVVRSRKSATRQTTPVALNLLPPPNDCVPAGACNVAQDWGQRRVIRTSIEIKNSGAVTLQ